MCIRDRVGTFWLGYVVGGGLILMLFGTLGWSNLLFAMAVIYILATIPIALNRPTRTASQPSSPTQAKSWGGIIEFIRQPKVLRIFALIAAFRLLEGFIRAILPSMLKDWGMGFEQIGFLLGVAAPVAALAGAIVAGGLANRLGRLNSLLIFGGFQTASALGYLLLTAKGTAPPTQFILPVIVIDHFISGMTTVALFSVMMDWSRKTHGGTDYTCMDCVGVFAMMFGAGLSYWLASEGGYGMSFGVALPLIGLSVFAVWRLYKSIQQNEPWRSLSQAETTTA